MKIASSSPAPAHVQASSPQPKIEACSLVSKEDVGAIQMATMTETKSSAGWYGDLVMSQCYYTAKEPNKSVSLALIQSDGRSRDSNPRQYWNHVFGAFKAGEGRELEREKEEKPAQSSEEKERKVPPKKIEGVGEQSYWSGNRFGGSLYVLAKEMILRISVGGPEDEETKISRSKAIAAKALRNF